MLTTELQRRTLYALQEGKFLKPGKEFLYSFEPFEITNMKKDRDGITELTITATTHEVINNGKMKAEVFEIKFNYNYNSGFLVIDCRRV